MSAGVRIPAPRVTRRTVLAAAAIGGAGAAAARLLGEDTLFRLPDVGASASRVGLDWVSPLGGESGKIAHLLRRATFGATAMQHEEALRDGYARTVERLVETPTAEPPPFPGGDDATRTQPLRVAQLQQWWLQHMLSTTTPFAERMTLFWHDHFPSDFRKVGTQSPFIYWQNLTWRRVGLGDLRSMLMAVTIDPAMLKYLDLSTSTGANPNENYSRELMELFTMGAGTFSEDDVRASAKALSGWREPLTEAMVRDLTAQAEMRGATRRIRTPDAAKTGVFEPRRAYAGTVTFLGKTARFDTQGVLDRILAQDMTAPFVVTKVLTHFVTPEPDASYVTRLAERFRRNGYDLKALMRDVFTSPEFVAPSAYRSLVKSPVEFMVHTARALANPALVRSATSAAQGMGQVLFDPPEVGGWPNNESWISSSTMLARVNYAATAVQQTRTLPPIDTAIAQHIDGVVSPQTAAFLNQARDDRQRWLVLLASPEFQLK